MEVHYWQQPLCSVLYHVIILNCNMKTNINTIIMCNSVTFTRFDRFPKIKYQINTNDDILYELKLNNFINKQ